MRVSSALSRIFKRNTNFHSILSSNPRHYCTPKNESPCLEKIVRSNEEKSDLYRGGNLALKEIDNEVYSIIKGEQDRQFYGLELIASENFTSRAVMECVGSCLTNKYSEGLPGQRYYGGNKYIDQLEILCQQRALSVFGLSDQEWGVNVQSYSGSTANMNAMGAYLSPGDRFMGLYLPDGGHLSHGFYRGNKSINQSSHYFESLPYYVNTQTGWLDLDDLELTAKRYSPKLIIAGSSAYPRDWDYKRFRQICDSIGAYLLVDMAHFSGLVAAGLMNDPFRYADVVTTTTHKSLRSTRAAMIFCKKDKLDIVNQAVFPFSQGGPHNHAIGGIAVALREAMSSNFVQYAQQMILNCKELANQLIQMGHKIATNGTDSHLLLWDLRPQNISGAKVEYLCELAHITINKNTVHGDKSALNPGGVRIGTPALTTRGFKENDMKIVANFLNDACKIAINIDKKESEQNGKKPKLAQFKQLCENNSDIQLLGDKVKEFAKDFPMPGVKLD